MSEFDELKRASENAMMFASDEESLEDRKLFVENLGWLLSQTREGIIGCELDDNEIVTVKFKRAYGSDCYEKKVNINMDSYMAIIYDVIKHI